MYTGKVGIFGGSFNPIHNGHLLCAERAAEQLELDLVFFIPNYCSPLKASKDYASAMDRSTMLWKAFGTNSKFYELTIEIESQKPCFTIDTLKKLAGDFKVPPYWLCGADSLMTMDTWKNPKGIMKFISGIGVFTQDLRTLGAPAYAREKIAPVYVPRIDIRSTSIRQRVIKGQSIRYMVPDGVAEIIKQRKLYHANGISDKA